MRILSIDPGGKHCAFCVLESGTNAIFFWFVGEVRGSDASAVVTALDDVLGPVAARHGAFEKVAIERQVPRNVSMVRLQAILETYCAMRYGLAAKVVAARSKFPAGTDVPKRYAERKRFAIDAATKFLADTADVNGAWTEFFEGAEKRDDLADSLLQAVRAVERR